MKYKVYIAMDDRNKMMFILAKPNSCDNKTLIPFHTLINDRSDLDRYDDLNWSNLERPKVPGVYEVIVEYKKIPDNSEIDYTLNILSYKAVLII